MIPGARTRPVATVPGWTTLATTPLPLTRRAHSKVTIITASLDWLQDRTMPHRYGRPRLAGSILARSEVEEPMVTTREGAPARSAVSKWRMSTNGAK